MLADAEHCQFDHDPEKEGREDCPKPGTALDDHLRREQTRAVLYLLADYMRKLDKDGEIRS